jgi:hypothetical protein
MYFKSQYSHRYVYKLIYIVTIIPKDDGIRNEE